MDNYPYSASAYLIRREKGPSILNGDAHHSLNWEVELRIWPLPVQKTLGDENITEVMRTEY
jgi:hypothetical protein